MNKEKKENSGVRKAVIYCRVSSIAQTKRGDGLASQETRCRDYARYNNLEVVGAYHDDKSGALMDRPAIRALIEFLGRNRNDRHVVIIDDISRLARGVKAHLGLREAIAMAGGVLKSPSIEFADDADSELQEMIMATVAQHQRRKNAEQTVNRMRARMMNGYWAFACPVGYRRERLPGHGKTLVRDEPLASIVQEALEGYASGRFQSQAEVKRFLERFPEIPRDSNGEVRNQRVKDLLTQSLYAGYIEHEGWNISLRKGQHEALIDYRTYCRIQERLAGPVQAPARKDNREDFPLRGFVLCADCGTPLTACWSKSKTGRKHPYYLCPTKRCASSRKSIRREDLEGEFDEVLRRLQPTEKLFRIARAMFLDAWAQRAAQAAELAKGFEREAAEIERQIEKLLSRIVEATNSRVIGTYESRIAELERRKAVATERSASGGKPRHTWEESFEPALQFLSSPWDIWSSRRFDLRRLVLRLAFSERISYRRGEGFSNPKTSMPFKVLEALSGGESRVARPRRFELLTF